MENKIRVLIFSGTASVLWVVLAWQAMTNTEPRTVGMTLTAVIAMFLTILAMGQGGQSDD
jgi:hypothetical protein